MTAGQHKIGQEEKEATRLTVYRLLSAAKPLELGQQNTASVTR